MIYHLNQFINLSSYGYIKIDSHKKITPVEPDQNVIYPYLDVLIVVIQVDEFTQCNLKIIPKPNKS